MSKRLVKIGEAARLLGTDHSTLRKWESTGELLPARKTKGGTRYYGLANDALEIITVFSARLYGSRNKNHKKMLEERCETYLGMQPC